MGFGTENSSVGASDVNSLDWGDDNLYSSTFLLLRRGGFRDGFSSAGIVLLNRHLLSSCPFLVEAHKNDCLQPSLHTNGVSLV